MTSAGYSATPLAKKLGIKAGHEVVLVHRPQDWRIPELPADVTVHGTERGRAADVTVAFFRTHADLERDAPGLVSCLPPASSLWIAWPRRAGGHESDITENDLRELLLPTGLVDVKVAALGEHWSGLKFSWRRENRPR
ncbi:DUF3052 domain-containing protein [Wenjunlia tyrosinilytica]|uniref:DUF3052 domain-containing protein n=1 Tax=Wenjunlia tyrosinilytica TaxID=1544741 RepID=A0A918DZX4_9ACTN|nr:DUF3052 domain-containing protein [Wenjunlia tyrosinilytica]GGO91180.1 hypothetical protein GCM10012280_38420 [Wenjunlia tyrosinilytica]